MDKLQNSLTDRLSRSLDLTKQTFHILMKDKEILLFPILAGIFSIITFAIFIAPFLVTIFVSEATGGQATPVLLYFGIFAFYFITSFMTIFFNAGVVHIAKTRMEGGDATFSEGLKAAFSHLGKIIQWALISATVGLILNILSSKAKEKGGVIGLIGSFVVSMIGMAWAIVTTFVVPSIVIKNLGPIDAIKSSVATIKKTWGESLVKWLGITLLRNAVLGVLALLLIGPAFLLLFFGQAFVFAFVLIGIYILLAAIVSIFFNTLDTIFNTALFIYADTGKEPSLYAKGTMKHAFVSE